MAEMLTSNPTVSAPPELLLLDSDPETNHYVQRLRESFRVTHASSIEAATGYLRRAPVKTQLLVSDLRAQGEETFGVFKVAKELPEPPTILVTTADVERVPEALLCGSDAILLKPFAPNLLFSRIGRLLRAQSEIRRQRSAHGHARHAHLAERSETILAGTNQIWPDTHCPYCNHRGVTSFEFCSYRRAWYACTDCKKVWIARRLDA